MKTIALSAASLMLAALSTVAQEHDHNVQHDSESDASTVSQMVHIDPETGEITTKAPEPQNKLDGTDQNQVITDDSENQFTFKDMQGGGTLIELNGQFQKTLNVVIDENGELKTGHHLPLEQPSELEPVND